MEVIRIIMELRNKNNIKKVVLLMKFVITYKVLTIPSDSEIENVKFDFTYDAKVSELGDLCSHINEYLQKFFAVGNYEIISMLKAEEESLGLSIEEATELATEVARILNK